MRRLLLVALAGCVDSTPTVATGPRELFEVTGEHVATTSIDARNDGLDINGDGTVDNQLSAAFAELVHEQFGDPQAGTDAATAAGQLAMTVEVQYAPDISELVNVTSYPNRAADTNLPVTIAAPLVGSLHGYAFTAGPGPLAIVIAPFGVPVTLPLEYARIRAVESGNELHAVVGGGVDPTIVHARLVPQWSDWLNAVIARDCEMPGCMCSLGTPGQNAIAFFDGDHDCSISTDELEANSLVQSFLEPDLVIDKDRYLSFGVSIDATFALRAP